MKQNVAVEQQPTAVTRTHEGGSARAPGAADQLRRSVMACMLWEGEFYESGQEIATRIASLVAQTDPTTCMEIAVEARHNMNLRHAPLLIAREMARLPEHKLLVAHTLEAIVERADELTEFLAIYWKGDTKRKKQPLSAQVKKGLARAFAKFNEYQFAKYDRRDATVKLRDSLFLCHAKPTDAQERYTKDERKAKSRRTPLQTRERLYEKIVYRALATPDTWEVALSAGADKKDTFARLMAEKQLGGLALLRNLRNMHEAGVEPELVKQALAEMSVERILPFRFVAAARHAPQWEQWIEPAMLKCMEGRPKLPGRTALLIDVSGSMMAPVSSKSDLLRLDAACGLAILARELCEEVLVLTFSDHTVVVPARHGFALRDAIVVSQPNSGTYLGQAVNRASQLTTGFNRLIVITDEQSADAVPNPPCEGWVLNVASAQNGVGYGAWNRVDGWSDAVFDYIIARQTT